MPDFNDAGKQKAERRMRRGGPMGARLAVEKPENAKSAAKRLLKYLGKRKLLLYALLATILLATGLSLAGPALLAKAIDIISIDVDDLSVHVDFGRLYPLIIALSSVYLVSSGLSYVQGLLAAKLSVNIVKTLRGNLFEKIEYLPLKYIDSHHHGDIMSRMTNDIENVSNSISSSISSLFSGILSLFGTLAIMLWYSPVLTLISLLTVPLTVLFGTKIAHSLRKLFAKQQSLLGSLNGQIEEMVTGHKTVIAFGREKRAISDFSETSAQLKKTSIRAQILAGMMGPIMNLIGNLSFLIIASAGGYMAYKGIISVGLIQAFVIYARQLTRPINELSNQYAQIQTALAGAERVFSIMDKPSEPNAGRLIPAAGDIRGEIELRDVTFSYKEGEPVLKGVNMHVKPGQKIAIVGATGAGKTTIVNLLTRFYDIDSGEILLDGVDIREYEKKELRRNIAIVLQDTVLFSETIGYNIRYGRLDATDDEVRAAAAAANADVFIERLPNGYDTPLSGAGSNLSGGQRQLLSIARAVLADPKILILDEATSNVDTRTEMHIQDAMIALMKNRTSLIIAHRLSTIRDADMIVVIENGVVAESGSHDELIAKRGAYYRLYQKQYAGIAT
jgi:ATP-binding cassette subfamily B protein